MINKICLPISLLKAKRKEYTLCFSFVLKNLYVATNNLSIWSHQIYTSILHIVFYTIHSFLTTKLPQQTDCYTKQPIKINPLDLIPLYLRCFLQTANSDEAPGFFCDNISYAAKVSDPVKSHMRHFHLFSRNNYGSNKTFSII